jgi:8-oxo-dGTP pyrophosphatase MutT (NUDIX family)
MINNVRIYYKEKCIFLTEDANSLVRNNKISNAWIFRRSDKSVDDLFRTFIETDFQTMMLQFNVSKLLEAFKSRFTLIKAGGGLVWNEREELLLIERLGKWDLPKGKLDPGETMAACAQREVEEETGIQDLSLDDFLKSTYHIYWADNQWILKQTDWYKMKASRQKLTPQAEEGITQTKWVSKSELTNYLSKTYPNIIDLLETYRM